MPAPEKSEEGEEEEEEEEEDRSVSHPCMAADTRVGFCKYFPSLFLLLQHFPKLQLDRNEGRMDGVSCLVHACVDCSDLSAAFDAGVVMPN